MAFCRPGTNCPFFCAATALAVVLFLRSITISGADRIGVCYGRVADNLPAPEEVAALYKSQNIGKVRIFDADSTVLRAFAGSGIEVTVGVPNDALRGIAGDQSTADAWVRNNVAAYYPATTIKYIAVGNEVLPDTTGVGQYLVPAIQNIYKAIQAVSLQDAIKVSTAHKTSILDVSYPPSAATFRSDVSGTLQPILDFLKQTGAPLMANVYPYFSYVSNPTDISLAYATFQQSSPNSDGYKNLFDATFDCLIYAMEKLGHGDIPIVVTESGWPSAGNPAATVSNAQTYNNGLIKHVLSSDGTPKRPGASIETFIYAIFNEDQKQGDETEKHWGLFNPDKSAVYPVQFSL